MRKRGKVDNSQADIVKALRGAGASVAITSALGNGFPDLVVGWRGSVCMLQEIKTGERKCDRELTGDEKTFHAKWSGPIAVVSTPDEAVNELMKVAKLVGVI